MFGCIEIEKMSNEFMKRPPPSLLLLFQSDFIFAQTLGTIFFQNERHPRFPGPRSSEICWLQTENGTRTGPHNFGRSPSAYQRKCGNSETGRFLNTAFKNTGLL